MEFGIIQYCNKLHRELVEDKITMDTIHMYISTIKLEKRAFYYSHINTLLLNTMINEYINEYNFDKAAKYRLEIKNTIDDLNSSDYLERQRIKKLISIGI